MKNRRIGVLENVAKSLTAFTLTERLVFSALATVCFVATAALLVTLNNALTVEVPANGGTLNEGIVGIPRFINPLLAISDADRDLTQLVYSGLLKVGPDGTLQPDLAASYDVSSDGLTYTFHIRDDATFQDGTPVTAADVVFTITKAQDPALQSPRRASWEGVTVKAIDDKTVEITLKDPYPPFLQNMTMGILPSHIWSNVSAEQFTFSQFNVEPVGSGPYEIKSIKRSSGGIPQSYTLVPFDKHVGGAAHISDLVLKFYQTQGALIDGYQAGDIQSMNGISPHTALALKALGDRVESVPIPRVFAVFFNQNQVPAFTYPEVRRALSETVDRQRIVDEVLSGYGVPLYGPLPMSLFGSIAEEAQPTATGTVDQAIAAATSTLAKDGWKPDPADGVLEKKSGKNTVRLEFSIATPNTPDFEAAAKIIQADWERLGAKVTLNFFDTGDLNQNIIRNRSYDSLFFGEVIGRDLDLYPFWDSSQRNDPGLNVALYTNLKADKYLETARTLSSLADRMNQYRQFQNEVDKDIPAAFVYSPDFIYVVPKELKGLDIGNVTIPSDRFLNVTNWYLETDRVWSVFEPKTPESSS